MPDTQELKDKKDLEKFLVLRNRDKEKKEGREGEGKRRRMWRSMPSPYNESCHCPEITEGPWHHIGVVILMSPSEPHFKNVPGSLWEDRCVRPVFPVWLSQPQHLNYTRSREPALSVNVANLHLLIWELES